MSYKKAPATDPPKNKKSKWFMVGVILSVFFCIVIFMPDVKTFNPIEKGHNGVDVGDLLPPGYHLVNKWPFIIAVPSGRVGGLIERGWYYDVEFYDYVIIPKDHVGVLTGNKGVLNKVLKPGTYPINLRQYEVTLVYTEKQTYEFKD